VRGGTHAGPALGQTAGERGERWRGEQGGWWRGRGRERGYAGRRCYALAPSRSFELFARSQVVVDTSLSASRVCRRIYVRATVRMCGLNARVKAVLRGPPVGLRAHSRACNRADAQLERSTIQLNGCERLGERWECQRSICVQQKWAWRLLEAQCACRREGWL
jgi:hypothetical protein